LHSFLRFEKIVFCILKSQFFKKTIMKLFLSLISLIVLNFFFFGGGWIKSLITKQRVNIHFPAKKTGKTELLTVATNNIKASNMLNKLTYPTKQKNTSKLQQQNHHIQSVSPKPTKHKARVVNSIFEPKENCSLSSWPST
jgi:hypothetical protein